MILNVVIYRQSSYSVEVRYVCIPGTPMSVCVPTLILICAGTYLKEGEGGEAE